MKNWLLSLSQEAIKEKMCIKLFCTTCGALKFRFELVKRSFEKNNQQFPWNAIRNSRHNRRALRTPCLHDLSYLDRKDATYFITKEISKLKEEELNVVPLHFIFTEIYQIKFENLIKDILKNTPAEKILLSMIKHSNDLTEKRRKKEVYESPERVAERKRIKKELKAKAHQERVKKYKDLGDRRKK